MYSLCSCLFKSKSAIVRALRDALILNHVSKVEAVISEKSGRNFNDLSSLIDIRSFYTF